MDTVTLRDCLGLHLEKKADRRVTSQLRIRKKAKRYLTRKVGSHSSFLAFTPSDTPTQFMKLIWSKHKAEVKIRSTMQSGCCFSETFQQIVLQESSDTIKRACLKDRQKSHRTHRHSKRVSVHRD